MTHTILRLDSSLFGDNGQSTQLNAHLVHDLLSKTPEAKVIHRNLTSLPHLTGEFLGALSTPSETRTEDQQQQVALADELIQELQQADVVILGAPMYNFSVPSQLKSWMDYVARAGTTFRYTSSGPEGLVSNKPVFIQTSRGGIHQGTDRDTIEPLLRNFFALLGIRDLKFTFAEGLNLADHKAIGWQNALQQLDTHLTSLQ
jgi:FMN-dependent NADH-azoreductase